jgi:glycosyltransferase involved in cell wall biosynthesis
VASAVDGLSEVLGPLDPDLVVPAADAAALAARLRRAWEEPSSLPDGRTCSAHARRYDWSEVAAAHETLYRRVLVDSGARPRPRVVWLDHTAVLGGAEIAMSRTVPALAADTHVVLGAHGPLEQRLATAGVSYEVLAMPSRARDVRRGEVVGFRGLLALPAALAYTLRLARRLRRLRPDIVHTNTMKAGLYGTIAARLAGTRVVWHVRDRLATDYLPRGPKHLVRSVLRRLPDAVVANSEATAATLGRASVVVPSPVAPDQPAPRGADAGGDGRLLVVMVGRLAPWKGQHVFVEAFARAFGPAEASAVIAGAALFGEDDYERSLRDLIDDLGVADRVRLLGQVDDPAPLLAGASIAVHASTIPEPFGLAVAEAMAAGLAVVASAGGPSELITDGVDGVLCPPGDTAALAQALVRLAADPGLRERLGARARARAADLSPARVAAQLADVYDHVLAAPRD